MCLFSIIQSINQGGHFDSIKIIIIIIKSEYVLKCFFGFCNLFLIISCQNRMFKTRLKISDVIFPFKCRPNFFDDDRYFRPMVCGKQNDRLCGFGQTLQSVFDIDDTYENSAVKILSYFNTNYDAVNKYIQRLEYVYIIYKENVDLDRATIENETSKYKLNKNIVDHNVFLYFLYYIKQKS